MLVPAIESLHCPALSPALDCARTSRLPRFHGIGVTFIRLMGTCRAWIRFTLFSVLALAYLARISL